MASRDLTLSVASFWLLPFQMLLALLYKRDAFYIRLKACWERVGRRSRGLKLDTSPFAVPREKNEEQYQRGKTRKAARGEAVNEIIGHSGSRSLFQDDFLLWLLSSFYTIKGGPSSFPFSLIWLFNNFSLFILPSSSFPRPILSSASITAVKFLPISVAYPQMIGFWDLKGSQGTHTVLVIVFHIVEIECV